MYSDTKVIDHMSDSKKGTAWYGAGKYNFSQISVVRIYAIVTVMSCSEQEIL